ncbi:SPOR domain-containing protein [Idiomarina piscisalsi]|uniref:SPOR domain-containing protein n=1 Tax=Idiomarina piscisalsi TaxID=1096243 RepID=UPI001F540DED|nr:SPOR domain-containing protein [Idiomarina piscisalsi]
MTLASPLQNRLVGTLILVALAVIIIPEVLDGKKEQPVDPIETIPLKPKSEEALQKPNALSDELVAEPVEEEPQLEDTEVTAESAEPIAEDKRLKAPPREPVEAEIDGKAWVIQLGAFSKEDSVRKLVEQLRDRGYAAYSEKSASGKITRLLVGPDTSEAELQKQLAPLKELTGLDGKIMTYKP